MGYSKGASNLGRERHHQAGSCGAHLASEEAMKAFAIEFRQRRENIRYTQYGVVDELRASYGPIMNQTTICRFEAWGTGTLVKQRLSFKKMTELKPILLKWIEEAESAASTNVTAQGTKRKSNEVSANNINKQHIKPS